MKIYFILIIVVCLLMPSFAQKTKESKRRYYRYEISGNIFSYRIRIWGGGSH